MGFEGFRGVTPELAERARACTNEGELKDLAADEGFDIGDDELWGVHGGVESPKVEMPEVCTSYNQK